MDRWNTSLAQQVHCLVMEFHEKQHLFPNGKRHARRYEEAPFGTHESFGRKDWKPSVVYTRIRPGQEKSCDFSVFSSLGLPGFRELGLDRRRSGTVLKTILREGAPEMTEGAKALMFLEPANLRRGRYVSLSHCSLLLLHQIFYYTSFWYCTKFWCSSRHPHRSRKLFHGKPAPLEAHAEARKTRAPGLPWSPCLVSF